MNEKTGTGVSSEKEKVKESQSRSVTLSLDTPSGAGLGCHNLVVSEHPGLDSDPPIGSDRRRDATYRISQVANFRNLENLAGCEFS